MRPDDDLRTPSLPAEISDKRVERLSHVAVAQVPGRHLLEEHRPIVRFGVLHHAGVLLRIEELVFRRATIMPCMLCGPALQLPELADDFVLARFGEAGAGDQAVDLSILAEVVEARI